LISASIRRHLSIMMKTVIVCAVCLVIGLTAGWFLGYRYYEWHIRNEAVKQMMEGMESSDRLIVAYAIRAIGLIQSGESQKASELLCGPIAGFYSEYAGLNHNDWRTQDTLARIETLAKTNTMIAAKISKQDERQNHQ
jgi:hypothetical protein